MSTCISLKTAHFSIIDKDAIRKILRNLCRTLQQTYCKEIGITPQMYMKQGEHSVGKFWWTVLNKGSYHFWSLKFIFFQFGPPLSLAIKVGPGTKVGLYYSTSLLLNIFIHIWTNHFLRYSVCPYLYEMKGGSESLNYISEYFIPTHYFKGAKWKV